MKAARLVTLVEYIMPRASQTKEMCSGTARRARGGMIAISGRAARGRTDANAERRAPPGPSPKTKQGARLATRAQLNPWSWTLPAAPEGLHQGSHPLLLRARFSRPGVWCAQRGSSEHHRWAAYARARLRRSAQMACAIVGTRPTRMKPSAHSGGWTRRNTDAAQLPE